MTPCRKNLLLYCLAAILLLILPGCQTQSVSSYYHGLQANPTESLPLPGKELQKGKWQTYDLLLDYQYQTEGNSLKISGATTLSDFYQINMNFLRKLDLFLFFLDKDAKVVETAQLLKVRSSSLDSPLSFNQTIEIPQAAKAIGFGYQGITRDIADLTRFDHLPKHSP